MTHEDTISALQAELKALERAMERRRERLIREREAKRRKEYERLAKKLGQSRKTN